MTERKTLAPDSVDTIDKLIQAIEVFVGRSQPQTRKLIGIAGPPASGKSTLLADLLNALEGRVIGIPMDGFHLDNVQLEQTDSLARKGSPHTFDIGGLLSLVHRLGTAESPIYAPEFDRANDLSRNCAIKIESHQDIVLLEGNYLLLDQPGWRDLNDHFDLTISIDVPDETLQKRLVQRWLSHGLSAEEALMRARSNDLLNAATVREQSLAANIVYRPEID